jgi:hypothetical protein
LLSLGVLVVVAEVWNGEVAIIAHIVIRAVVGIGVVLGGLRLRGSLRLRGCLRLRRSAWLLDRSI